MMVGETFRYGQERTNDESSHHSRSWNYPCGRSRNTYCSGRYQRCQPNRYSINDSNLHTSIYGSRRTNTSNTTVQLGNPRQNRNIANEKRRAK